MPTPGRRFSKLDWLKRTNGHKIRPADFRVLVSIYNHSDGDGRNSYPGRSRIAEEACVAETTVSECVRRLVADGWIREVKRGNGVTRKFSEYALVDNAPSPGMSAPDDLHMSAYGDTGMSALADTNQILVSDPESDPLESRAIESPTHQGSPVGTASFGRSLAVGEEEPAAQGEVSGRQDAERGSPDFWSSLGDPFTGQPRVESAPIPWPRDKPLPPDPWSTYVDAETGEPLRRTTDLPEMPATIIPERSA